MLEEVWKDVEDYEGLYWVSNLGRIKSKRKILNPTESEYLKVGLSKSGKQRTITVHRLVAKAFIENPHNYNFINHKDENKLNNNVNNLEWCTNKYNLNYGTRNEKVSKNQSKYKIIQKDNNGNTIKKWNNIWDLTHNTKYKKDNISCCCRGKYKTAYGYKWEYEPIKIEVVV